MMPKSLTINPFFINLRNIIQSIILGIFIEYKWINRIEMNVCTQERDLQSLFVDLHSVEHVKVNKSNEVENNRI